MYEKVYNCISSPPPNGFIPLEMPLWLKNIHTPFPFCLAMT